MYLLLVGWWLVVGGWWLVVGCVFFLHTPISELTVYPSYTRPSASLRSEKVVFLQFSNLELSHYDCRCYNFASFSQIRFTLSNNVSFWHYSVNLLVIIDPLLLGTIYGY